MRHPSRHWTTPDAKQKLAANCGFFGHGTPPADLLARQRPPGPGGPQKVHGRCGKGHDGVCGAQPLHERAAGLRSLSSGEHTEDNGRARSRGAHSAPGRALPRPAHFRLRACAERSTLAERGRARVLVPLGGEPTRFYDPSALGLTSWAGCGSWSVPTPPTDRLTSCPVLQLQRRHCRSRSRLNQRHSVRACGRACRGSSESTTGHFPRSLLPLCAVVER